MCSIMEKKNRRLVISEEFKLSVLRDYYSSGMSKRACSDNAKFLAKEVLVCYKAAIFASRTNSGRNVQPQQRKLP